LGSFLSSFLFLLQTAGAVHLSGTVTRIVGTEQVPLVGATVTFHRATAPAGPLDSVRTDSHGRFSFTYRGAVDDSAVFLATAAYGGLTYVSTPVTTANIATVSGDIVVYDTTSRPIPIGVRGRHLILTSPAAGGLRDVIEVYELTADTSLARIAPAKTAESATWSAGIPANGQRFRVTGGGDIPPEAVTFDRGRINVFAPLSPIQRQLAFAYALPAGDNDIDVHVPTTTQVFELLFEDAAAKVKGASVREMPAVDLEGRTFRRFLAENVPAGSILRVELPAVARALEPWFLATLTLVFGGAMLLALAYAYRRR
jgi:hypothetical protein